MTAPTNAAAVTGQAAYTLNSAPVARERFYELACDPARSVVVEACAGAGKTWMLVSRILRALLDGARPQDIVAITFTRKAAGEKSPRQQRLHPAGPRLTRPWPVVRGRRDSNVHTRLDPAPTIRTMALGERSPRRQRSHPPGPSPDPMPLAPPRGLACGLT